MSVLAGGKLKKRGGFPEKGEKVKDKLQKI